MKPSYFGNNYITQQQWARFWAESLQLDYTPVVDVRKVRLKKFSQSIDSPIEAVKSAVLEVAKYQVKGSDLVGKGTQLDKQFLVELTTQLNATKQITMGGVLGNLLKIVSQRNQKLLMQLRQNKS